MQQSASISSREHLTEHTQTQESANLGSVATATRVTTITTRTEERSTIIQSESSAIIKESGNEIENTQSTRDNPIANPVEGKGAGISTQPKPIPSSQKEQHVLKPSDDVASTQPHISDDVDVSTVSVQTSLPFLEHPPQAQSEAPKSPAPEGNPTNEHESPDDHSRSEMKSNDHSCIVQTEATDTAVVAPATDSDVATEHQQSFLQEWNTVQSNLDSLVQSYPTQSGQWVHLLAGGDSDSLKKIESESASLKKKLAEAENHRKQLKRKASAELESVRATIHRLQQQEARLREAQQHSSDTSEVDKSLDDWQKVLKKFQK